MVCCLSPVVRTSCAVCRAAAAMPHMAFAGKAQFLPVGVLANLPPPLPLPPTPLPPGYSSVDIGVVWRPCSVVELTCIKPTNRVAQYLSLGIPVVFKATAAYADIVALSGYPLVAHNVTHAMQLIVSAVRAGTKHGAK